MICIFSGHRALPKPQEHLKYILTQQIEELINKGCFEFVSGGASGFDLLAAELVLELKAFLPQVRLYMVLPCPKQDKNYISEDKERYNEVLSRADKVRYTSDKYYKGCMLARNDTMIELADFCICYLTHSKSGTGYTVRRAVAKGVQIINLAEYI